MPAWPHWEAPPEVRRLLQLTLVLLSLWFADVRGPLGGEEGGRRPLGDPRELAPGLRDWVDDLLPRPTGARRQLAASPTSAPMRARRR